MRKRKRLSKLPILSSDFHIDIKLSSSSTNLSLVAWGRMLSSHWSIYYIPLFVPFGIPWSHSPLLSSNLQMEIIFAHVIVDFEVWDCKQLRTQCHKERTRDWPARNPLTLVEGREASTTAPIHPILSLDNFIQTSLPHTSRKSQSQLQQLHDHWVPLLSSVILLP